MSDWYRTEVIMTIPSKSVALALVCACGCRSSGSSGWPNIVPLRESAVFTEGVAASADWTIRGAEGKPLYRIACHTSGYEQDPDFVYSGDFECRLASLYSREAQSTLFTDNPQQSRDWESRARFLAEELVGKCSSYPEFGSVRHFRLRGMRITLSVTDFVLDTVQQEEAPGHRLGLKSFRFQLAVERDPRAVSALAEPVPYVEPLYRDPDHPERLVRNCDVVRRSAGPRGGH
jgi:hypothetical protein